MNTTPNTTNADPDGSEALYFASLNSVLDSKAWFDVTSRMELLASTFAHLSGQCGHPLDVDVEALRTELDELSSALLRFQPKHDALANLKAMRMT